MPNTNPEAGRPLACIKPAPYSRKVRTYSKVLDAFITSIPNLTRQQRSALKDLRIEAGAKIQGFDATPQQLKTLWGVRDEKTARAYLKAFQAAGIATVVHGYNRGARISTKYAFDFSTFPQFGDVLKKPVKASPAPPPRAQEETPSVVEPKGISPDSPEGEEPSLRSGSFSSRENQNNSRKAPEAGATAGKAEKPSGGKNASQLVAEAVLEQGAKLIQKELPLDQHWARKAMAQCAKAFRTWGELEAYAKALALVLRKVQAKGSLAPELLERLAYKRLVAAVDPRRKGKILREASTAAGFLERLEAKRAEQADQVARSPLAAGQMAVVDGIRVQVPAGITQPLLLPYLAWFKACAALPRNEDDPGYLARFEERQSTGKALMAAMEGELGEQRLRAIETGLADRLRATGLAEGSAVWDRAWRHHRAKEIMTTFGVDPNA